VKTASQNLNKSSPGLGFTTCLLGVDLVGVLGKFRNLGLNCIGDCRSPLEMIVDKVIFKGAQRFLEGCILSQVRSAPSRCGSRYSEVWLGGKCIVRSFGDLRLTSAFCVRLWALIFVWVVNGVVTKHLRFSMTPMVDNGYLSLFLDGALLPVSLAWKRRLVIHGACAGCEQRWGGV